MQDAERMTLGMWVDYIVEYNKMQEYSGEDSDGKKNVTRKATQGDFDRF